ncbi:MAG: enolase C-terminal domain-like protein [Candidatus Bipolaricaulota bacterium]
MAKKASNLVSEGFNVLKIKLGENVDLDLERLEEINGAVGDRIKLRIDANQGWSRTEALLFMSQLDRENVQFVEQPIAADDLEGMRYLRDNAGVPILADESVHGPESALGLIRRGAADFLNIKLSKCGGF